MPSYTKLSDIGYLNDSYPYLKNVCIPSCIDRDPGCGSGNSCCGNDCNNCERTDCDCIKYESVKDFTDTDLYDPLYDIQCKNGWRRKSYKPLHDEDIVFIDYPTLLF